MDGAKVLIDSAVLERVDATQPPYLSRTSWVNHLLDCAVTPPHVDQYTIEAVKENVDILKIISEEVEPVEEGNARYIGTCPIHESEATTPWANARAAATFLAVSERTLARWRSSGLLKSGDHYRRKFPRPNSAVLYHLFRCEEAMAAATASDACLLELANG